MVSMNIIIFILISTVTIFLQIEDVFIKYVY